jgi:SAM-dependent methyltransferase
LKPFRSLRPIVKKVVPAPVRDRVRAWVRATPAAGIYTLAEDEFAQIQREVDGLNGRPWRETRKWHSTAGMDERVVEIPWVLSRYRGERRVLDVGTAWSLPVYQHNLVGLRIAELHGVDITVKPVSGVIMTRGDVRHLPYREESIDLIICISTLEHIGLDNAVYGTVGRQQEDGDVFTLREFSRVLAPGGRVLITVPFGRRQRLDWLQQYDQPAWDALISRTDLLIGELAHFGYSDVRGWRPAEAPHLPAGDFQGSGASAATGVLCAELKKR